MFASIGLLLIGRRKTASKPKSSSAALDRMLAVLEADDHLKAYRRAQRIYRYEMAAIFSAMLIVLVTVGAVLLFGY